MPTISFSRAHVSIIGPISATRTDYGTAFDHLALMADDTTHSREYTTTLLFVYLYLNQGNGTPVPLQTSIPSADSPMGDWMLLVNGWIRTANSPDFQKAHPNVRPGGLVSSLSAVIALPDALLMHHTTAS